MESTKILLAIFLFGIIYGASGHSYVTSPTSRSNQRQSNAGCRGPACLGPCDVPLSRKTLAPIQVSRGQSITIQWPRNNHAGGFIRFAWSPTSMSDSHTSFDNNVQQINCHEVGGCGPDNVNDPNGGDSGPADGSRRACQSTLSVPPHLADGEWTLQWAWFGGAFALGDYYSCIDYKIVGGQNGTFTPTFVGGDFSFPNQPKCKFFNTNQLHKCTNEPCNNPIFPSSVQQSGAPAFIQQNLTPSPSPSPAPVSTTGSNIPSTTGSVPVVAPAPAPVVPSTTGSVPVVAPTPVAPSTTGSNVVTSPPTQSNGMTCVGSVTSSASKAVAGTVETWNGGKSFRLVVLVLSQEATLSNWIVEATWPSSDVTVDGAYNAGVLACQSGGKASFKPSGSWANNIAYGSVQNVEIIGRSTRALDSQTILNSVLKVYSQ